MIKSSKSLIQAVYHKPKIKQSHEKTSSIQKLITTLLSSVQKAIKGDAGSRDI